MHLVMLQKMPLHGAGKPTIDLSWPFDREVGTMGARGLLLYRRVLGKLEVYNGVLVEPN